MIKDKIAAKNLVFSNYPVGLYGKIFKVDINTTI